ncbi:MAG: SRPBCC family protein [Calditrichia bacterium]
MKYTCTVEIDLPRDKAAKLWADESNFKEWQDGFISIERLSGDAEAEGTKSRILLKQGKGQMELIETIIHSNLPEEKKAFYEHIHMDNTQTTTFEAITATRTRCISEVEYTKFKSFIPKVMAFLFPGVFKSQSQKWLDQFKAFAEKKR